MESGQCVVRWFGNQKKKKWFSKTLLIIGKSDIGLKSPALLFSSRFFGIWTTEDSFHSDGRQLHLMEQLKSSVTEGAMVAVVFFSIRAEMPSGPVDLVVSRDRRIL